MFVIINPSNILSEGEPSEVFEFPKENLFWDRYDYTIRITINDNDTDFFENWLLENLRIRRNKKEITFTDFKGDYFSFNGCFPTSKVSDDGRTVYSFSIDRYWLSTTWRWKDQLEDGVKKYLLNRNMKNLIDIIEGKNKKVKVKKVEDSEWI